MPDATALIYGFPQSLLKQVNEAFPGNAGPCGLCGDTILGQRHRIIDAIAERLAAGEYEVGEDYGIEDADLWVIVLASHEHGKAIARQRRAERRAAS